MNFKISTGQIKDIEVGALVTVITGYLPAKFDNQMIEILELSEGYPKAQLEDGQLSAIDPQIITHVYY